MQWRQRPHVTWPSPLTRSPGWKSETLLPTSTMWPTNSWPTTSGGLMVFSAQPSQASMCRSVPQIPVLWTRIRTSLMPGTGFGTRSRRRPGPASVFTSASIPGLGLSLARGRRRGAGRSGCVGRGRRVGRGGRVRRARRRGRAGAVELLGVRLLVVLVEEREDLGRIPLLQRQDLVPEHGDIRELHVVEAGHDGADHALRDVADGTVRERRDEGREGSLLVRIATVALARIAAVEDHQAAVLHVVDPVLGNRDLVGTVEPRDDRPGHPGHVVVIATGGRAEGVLDIGADGHVLAAHVVLVVADVGGRARGGRRRRTRRPLRQAGVALLGEAHVEDRAGDDHDDGQGRVDQAVAIALGERSARRRDATRPGTGAALRGRPARGRDQAETSSSAWGDGRRARSERRKAYRFGLDLVEPCGHRRPGEAPEEQGGERRHEEGWDHETVQEGDRDRRDGQAGQPEGEGPGGRLALEGQGQAEDRVGEEGHDDEAGQAHRRVDREVDDVRQRQTDPGQDEKAVDEEEGHAPGHASEANGHPAAFWGPRRLTAPAALAYGSLNRFSRGRRRTRVEQRPSRPRIADVAREAGVSKTAVSFAFNSPERLAPETATRIREVADSLGYRPHPVARMLTQRQTMTLGVLTPQALAVIFSNPLDRKSVV